MPRPRILQQVMRIGRTESFWERPTTKLLERDHRVVELFILVDDDLLLLALSDHQTSITPTELVHAPEGIDRQEEAVDRIARRMQRQSGKYVR